MLIIIFALTVALAATSAIFATWTHREVNDIKKQLKNKFDFEESDIYK